MSAHPAEQSRFHADPWDVAQRHYEREMRMFMARLLQHFNVTQVTLDMSKTIRTNNVIKMTELLNGDRHYRIIDKLELTQE